MSGGMLMIGYGPGYPPRPARSRYIIDLPMGLTRTEADARAREILHEWDDVLIAEVGEQNLPRGYYTIIIRSSMEQWDARQF